MNNPELKLDDKQIAEIKGLLEEGFGDFINVYLQDFENKERDLQLAVINKNFDSILKIAHALKGSSLNVGANGLADICTKIENAVKKNDNEDVTNQSQILHDAYPFYKRKYLQLTSS